MTMKSCRIPAMVSVDGEETKDMAELKEQAWHLMSRYRERIGEAAFKRYVVEKVLEVVETAAGGDESIIFGENGFESAAQRVNETEMFDEKSGLLYDECAANSAVGLLINKLRVGAEVSMNELAMDGVKSGVLREEEECLVLYEECAKSVADLCIMKMRFGALVDKLDKRIIVETEIAEARRIHTELMEGFWAFLRNLRANEVTRKQDSETNALCQDYDVGGSVTDDKMIEMAKRKGAAFENESLRVLVEMMKGVKTGEKRGAALDEAMALIREWTVAKIDKCVLKVVLGVVMDRQSINKTLQSEVVDAGTMEKEVHDRLVIFRRNHAHAQESSAATIVEEKNSEDGIVTVGGDKHANAQESCAAAIVEEKNNEDGTVTVVGSFQRKRLIERLGLVWRKDVSLLLPPIVVGIFAAVGAVWQKVLLLLVPTVVGVSLLWLD